MEKLSLLLWPLKLQSECGYQQLVGIKSTGIFNQIKLILIYLDCRQCFQQSSYFTFWKILKFGTEMNKSANQIAIVLCIYCIVLYCYIVYCKSNVILFHTQFNCVIYLIICNNEYSIVILLCIVSQMSYNSI